MSVCDLIGPAAGLTSPQLWEDRKHRFRNSSLLFYVKSKSEAGTSFRLSPLHFDIDQPRSDKCDVGVRDPASASEDIDGHPIHNPQSPILRNVRNPPALPPSPSLTRGSPLLSWGSPRPSRSSRFTELSNPSRDTMHGGESGLTATYRVCR